MADFISTQFECVAAYCKQTKTEATEWMNQQVRMWARYPDQLVTKLQRAVTRALRSLRTFEDKLEKRIEALVPSDFFLQINTAAHQIKDCATEIKKSLSTVDQSFTSLNEKLHSAEKQVEEAVEGDSRLSFERGDLVPASDQPLIVRETARIFHRTFHRLSFDWSKIEIIHTLRDQFRRIIGASLASKLIINPFNRGKAELVGLIADQKESFTTLCREQAIDLSRDEMGDVELWGEISAQVTQGTEAVVCLRKKELVLKCRPTLDLSQVSPSQLDTLYTVSLEEMRTVERVQLQLNEHLASAKLPEELKAHYAVTVTHGGGGEEGTPFTIELVSEDEPAGLKLQGEEIEKFSQRLCQLKDQFCDFVQITSDLLLVGTGEEREEMEKYVSLGLTLQGQRPMLLTDKLLLNIETHPQRDALKSKIQELLRLSNQLELHFELEEPYRINLSFSEVEKMASPLQKLLHFLKYKKEWQDSIFSTTKSEEIEKIGGRLGSQEEKRDAYLFLQHHVAKLHDVYQVLGKTPPSNLALFLLPFEAEIRRGDDFFLQCMDLTEKKSEARLKRLLNTNAGPYFVKVTSFEPTAEEIVALYEGERDHIYVHRDRKGVEHRQVHWNVPKLFQVLRRQPAYQDCVAKTPNYEKQLAAWEADFVRRLNKYYALDDSHTFYGKAMIDEAVRQLEHYVALVVYRERSKVDHTAVERSLIKLSASVGRDMTKGCAIGFAQRAQGVRLACFGVGFDLKDNLLQFQKECLEVAFQKVFGESEESSMQVQHQEIALHFLQGKEGVTWYGLGSAVQQLLRQFSQEYTPAAIYRRAEQFLVSKVVEFNQEGNDEAMYRLLEELGFGFDREQLDRKYRLNGDALFKWQEFFFQQDLMPRLMSFLFQEKWLKEKGQTSSDPFLPRDTL